MIPTETTQQKLANWHPPGEGRQVLAITDEAATWSASISADRQDVIGCLVWEVAVQAATPRPQPLDAWADQVAQKVTSLPRLKVVEVDAQRNEALLRTDAPAFQGDTVVYHEVRLKGTSQALLRRFQASRQPGSQRQQQAFALTHETLAKVIAELTTD